MIRSSLRTLVWIGWTVALLLPAPAARGHAFAPALLELRQTGEHEIALRFKQPSVRAVGSALTPVLPNGCRPTGKGSVARQGTGLVVERSFRCARGLVGSSVGVSGIAASRADVLLRLELLDGRSIRHVLTLAEPSIVVPERQGVGALVLSYGELGFEHILAGFDHLLFVFGLILLVRGGRRLVATITAFTVGHSLTLAAAALGLIFVPQAPVEVLIAFSLLVLAVELTRDGAGSRAARTSCAMAVGFGLLHGLGFAGALSEAGLPQHDVPAALFAFNLGIEAGQLAFVGLVLGVAGVSSTVLSRLQSMNFTLLRAQARTASIYTLGILSAFWCFERLGAV